MTFDLDLVVDLSDANLGTLVRVLEREGYRPRLPVPLLALADGRLREEWVLERNLIAFTLHHPGRPMEEVDILVAPGVDWAEVSASLILRQIDDVPVPVVGRALLRCMKLRTGREKDLVDAELLAGDGDDNS